MARTLLAEVPVLPSAVSEGEVSCNPRVGAHGDRATLKGLLADPQACARLGQAGRRRVEEEFSWSRTAAQFRALYRQVGG